MAVNRTRKNNDYMAYAALSLLASSIQVHAATADSDPTLNTVVVTGNRGDKPRTVLTARHPLM